MELFLLICIFLLQVMLLAWQIVAMNRPQAERPEQVEAPERAPKKDPIDEGFENIMQYSVGGKTGFEGLADSEE